MVALPGTWGSAVGRRITIDGVSSRTILSVGALAAVILGALVALLPTEGAALLTAGVIAVLGLTLVPYRVVLGLWAGSLALWALGPLSPTHMDAFRVSVAALLVIRGTTVAPARRSAVVSWVLTLVLVGTLVWVGGAHTLGTAIVVPALLVGAVLTRTDDTRTALVGYSLGVSLSAIVLLLTALGVEAIAPNQNPGLDRLTGLANNAPRVSMQCAAAIVITLGLGWRRHRARSVVVLATCSLALVASGGRVGILCLLVATLVAAFRGWLTFSRSVAVVGGGVLILFLAVRVGIGTATLDRFSAASQAADVDFTSGRLAVIEPALRSVLGNPVVPVGLETFDAHFGVAPHSPVLSFGLAGGLAASVLALVMLVRMGLLMARRRGSSSSEHRASVLVLAVLFGYALVEPDGPFVGVEMLALLMLSATTTQVAAAVGGSPQPVDPSSRTTPTRAGSADRGGLGPPREDEAGARAAVAARLRGLPTYP